MRQRAQLGQRRHGGADAGIQRGRQACLPHPPAGRGPGAAEPGGGARAGILVSRMYHHIAGRAAAPLQTCQTCPLVRLPQSMQAVPLRGACSHDVKGQIVAGGEEHGVIGHCTGLWEAHGVC